MQCLLSCHFPLVGVGPAYQQLSGAYVPWVGHVLWRKLKADAMCPLPGPGLLYYFPVKGQLRILPLTALD